MSAQGGVGHRDRAREAQQRVELRTGGVLPRCMIGEGAIHGDIFELSIRVLVQGTDPDIAEALSKQGALLIRSGKSLYCFGTEVNK